MNIDMPNVVVRDEMIDGERKTMARVTLNADSKFVETLDAWCKLTDKCRKIDLHSAGWTVQYLVPACYLFGTIPVDDEEDDKLLTRNDSVENDKCFDGVI